MPDDKPPQFNEDEAKALRELIRDHDRAKWLRGQLRIWILWCLGIPAAVLGFLASVEAIVNALRKVIR
jgi:hypothetical protein